jgi:hypothetical protein
MFDKDWPWLDEVQKSTTALHGVMRAYSLLDLLEFEMAHEAGAKVTGRH